MSAFCEEGLGATGPLIPETASQKIRNCGQPETTAAFPFSQELVVESRGTQILLLLTFIPTDRDRSEGGGRRGDVLPVP